MNIKIRKIISFLLLMIILLTNLSPVFAGSFNEGQKITLEKDHDCISLLKFQGKDMLKGITYVVYRDPATGKTQPAFCVEPNQEGVGTGAGDSYDVTLSLMKDQKLWRVLYKGYMGSKYSDWGLNAMTIYITLQKRLYIVFAMELPQRENMKYPIVWVGVKM